MKGCVCDGLGRSYESHDAAKLTLLVVHIKTTLPKNYKNTSWTENERWMCVSLSKRHNWSRYAALIHTGGGGHHEKRTSSPFFSRGLIF